MATMTKKLKEAIKELLELYDKTKEQDSEFNINFKKQAVDLFNEVLNEEIEVVIAPPSKEKI